MTPSRWAFVATLVFAAATTVIAVLMNIPPAPEGAAPMADGYATPILALEFARQVSDLHFLTGEEGAALRAWLVRVQFLDWFFPVAYAGMAAAFFLGLVLRGNLLALLGIGLALAAIPADWRENAVMNAILHELENPVCDTQTRTAECPGADAFGGASAEPAIAAHSFDTVLPAQIERLKLDTWVKWGLIAAYGALLAGLFWAGRRRMLAVPPALGALAIAAAWISGSNGYVAEIMGLLLIPFMLTFPIAAVMYLRARPVAEREAP
ncbi:MAG: hypothetical protein JJU18_02330 [Oceanicaulis sp.]|nr:hypothetical protein [Oceanicaulis sp.]